MITLYNRRKLCVTRSIEAQQAMCDCLKQHGIDYRFKMIDRTNYPNEMITKVSYENKEVLYQFYVHKKDYELAIHVIKKVNDNVFTS